jgi:hypothetical protein
MAHYRLPIASAANVELKTVCAVFQCQIKRSQSVFRRAVAGAAMSEQ